MHLFLEIAYSVVICVSEEVLDTWVCPADVRLEMVHKVTTISLQARMVSSPVEYGDLCRKLRTLTW